MFFLSNCHKSLVLPILGALLFLSNELSAQWNTYAPMPGTRWAHVTAASGGRLYVAGGSVSPTWEYDPIADTWATRASIPTARSYPAIATWNGMIYVLGGSQGAAWSTKNERYDPATDTWTTLADMPQARTTTAAGAVNGQIFVVNGWNGTAMSSVDVYDIATDTWSTAAPAPTGRSHAKTAVINNRIYLVGGYASGWVGTNEVYDPGSNTWQTLAPMPTARYIHAVGEVGSQIYVAGGYTGSASNVTESYNSLANTWSAEAAMPTARYRTDGAAVNGCFYVLGGYNGSNLSVNEGFCGVVLPVDVELRGVESGGGVALEWEDGEVEGVENFVVERAGPAGEFVGIGQMAAWEGSGGHFEYFDAAPMAGRNLYRLRRVDRDGEAGNSAAIEVNFSGAGEIRLGWDAGAEALVVKWGMQDLGAVGIEVFDVQGRQVAAFGFDADERAGGSASFSFPEPPQGVYLIRIASSSGQRTHRMVLGR